MEAPTAGGSSAGVTSGGGGGEGGEEEDPNKTVLCLICFDKAISHVHYGGKCCFSCKAFFRRAVNWQNKHSKNFECKKAGSCDINVKTRKLCQCCRFQKCLDTGMNPKWVLSEEERSKRFKGQTTKKSLSAPSTPKKRGRPRKIPVEESLEGPAALARPLAAALSMWQARQRLTTNAPSYLNLDTYSIPMSSPHVQMPLRFTPQAAFYPGLPQIKVEQEEVERRYETPDLELSLSEDLEVSYLVRLLRDTSTLDRLTISSKISSCTHWHKLFANYFENAHLDNHSDFHSLISWGMSQAIELLVQKMLLFLAELMSFTSQTLSDQECLLIRNMRHVLLLDMVRIQALNTSSPSTEVIFRENSSGNPGVSLSFFRYLPDLSTSGQSCQRLQPDCDQSVLVTILEKLTSLKLPPPVFVLLLLIAQFSSVALVVPSANVPQAWLLERPIFVDQCQLHYLKLLQKYLQSHYGRLKGFSVMAKIMNVISCLTN